MPPRRHRGSADLDFGAYTLLGGYTYVWQELIPPDTLVSQDPLERTIEVQLGQKLYKHDRIPDDEVLLPTVWLTPVAPDPAASRKSLGDAVPPKTQIRAQDERATEG